MNPGHCRSCQRPVYWLANVTTGKLAPIDVEPDPDGNVIADLAAGVYIVVGGRREPQPTLIDLTAETPLRTNHFQTCPHAAVHRPSPASAATR